MTRFKVNIPLLGLVGFAVPQLNSLSKVLGYVQLWSLYLFIFALPLLYLLNNNNSYSENILFFGTLYFVTFAVGVYLVRVTLFGNSLIQDPKGFIVVLLFALFTTSASLSIDSPTTANTFGTDDFRALSGVFIMGALGLYYIVNVTVKDKNTFKRILFTLLVSNIVLAYLVLFSQVAFDLGWIVLLPLPIFIGFSLTFRRLWWLFAGIASFIFVGLSIVSDTFETGISELYVEPQIILFNLLLTLSLLLMVFVQHPSKKIQRNTTLLSKIIRRRKKNAKFSSYLAYQAALSLVIFAGTVLFMYLIFDSSTFNDSISDVRDEYTLAWESIADNGSEGFEQVQNIVFGVGSDNVDISAPLFANVIAAQGMVGILAYIILFGFGTQVAIQQINVAVQHNDYFALVMALSVYVIGLPLLNIFAYTGIFSIIIWWIAFSMLTAFSMFAHEGSEKVYYEGELTTADTQVKDETISRYIRVGFALLVALIFVLILVQLVNSVGEV